MKLWECFVCGSATVCGHREPELLEWAFEQWRRAGPVVEFTASLNGRFPPARELGGGIPAAKRGAS